MSVPYMPSTYSFGKHGYNYFGINQIVLKSIGFGSNYCLGSYYIVPLKTVVRQNRTAVIKT